MKKWHKTPVYNCQRLTYKQGRQEIVSSLFVLAEEVSAKGGEAMEEALKGHAHAREDCLCERSQATRRDFLQFTGGTIATATILASPVYVMAAQDEGDEGGIGGFFKSVFGICKTPELPPSHWSLKGNEVRIQVDKVAELGEPSGAVYLKGKGLDVPVLILKSEDGKYRAFSNKCTHMGRKLDPVHGKEVLRCCSVSHATYDYQGNVIGGPAKGPLTVYEVLVMGNEIVVRI